MKLTKKDLVQAIQTLQTPKDDGNLYGEAVMANDVLLKQTHALQDLLDFRSHWLVSLLFGNRLDKITDQILTFNQMGLIYTSTIKHTLAPTNEDTGDNQSE
jgi:hypothetical protein